MDTATFPEAEISNNLIRARLLLPDPERGYYRATRFDWSGLISSLECDGHNYFGPWFERHDPKTHDAIVGPVEEFQCDEGGPGSAIQTVGHALAGGGGPGWRGRLEKRRSVGAHSPACSFRNKKECAAYSGGCVMNLAAVKARRGLRPAMGSGGELATGRMAVRASGCD
jgi:hypothetical protein